MSKYQQHLKEKYKSMKYISPDEMLDCFSTNYIELSLKPEYSNEYVTLYEALKVQIRTGNLILFVGNPGMGKTTLAVNICKRWAEGNLLQGYNAVILLPLCDPEIQGAKSISDLLLTLDDEMRESVFKEIVKSDGEGICFILEGYDELPKKCMNEFSVFSKLKSELTKCTIVYTSRPEARPYVHRYHYLKIIEINGFKKESINRYISNSFKHMKNGKVLTDDLKSQLYNNPVVESILHVPINLAIVCLIFFHFSTLPETLTELYTLLCLRLILRHIVTRTPNGEEVEKLTSLNNLPRIISEQFFQLCFLAYKGMESRTIVFYSQYLSDIGVDEAKMSCLGLLQIAPTTSVYGREKSYNFIHLTLQEFCAAWYISKLSSEEQVKVYKIYYYDDQFEMVWQFYSGITGLNNRQILNLMLPYKLATSESTKRRIIRLLYHVHEARNDEVCKIIGDHYDGSFADLYPEHLRFVTYAFSNHKTLLQVFSHFLIHYKGALRLMDLRDWQFITDTELTIIVSSLEKRWKMLNNATSDNLILKLSLKKITSQSYSLLVNLLKQQYPITELYINEYYVHSITIHFDSMKELLTQSSTLCVVDISGNPIGLMGATRLAYCRNILVKDLRMRECKISRMEAHFIGKMLTHNKSIISIDLSSNVIEDKGVERIVDHIKHGNTLQCIKLCNNKITAVGINYLTSKLLEMNTTLTSLDLSHNRLQYEDVCLFLNSLTITMEYIGLYGYKFVHKAIAATQAMHKAKSYGFAYYINHTTKLQLDLSSDSTALIQQVVVHVTSEKVHYRMLKVISTIDNIKELKIYYNRRLSLRMAKDLSVCAVRSETVEISAETSKQDNTSIALEMVKSFVSKPSIKKIIVKCHLWIPFQLTPLIQELLAEIPDTLEELTLPYTHLFGTHLNLDEMLQEINKLRSTKNGVNPLQVNIFHERHEGFDIDLQKLYMYS